jgi:hypothetical protein
MTRYRVFKVKPGVVGYGTLAAAAYPWLVTSVDSERGRAFPTHHQALHYAVTGEWPRSAMSPAEKAEWRARNAEFFALWRAKSKEARRNQDGSRLIKFSELSG